MYIFNSELFYHDPPSGCHYITSTLKRDKQKRLLNDSKRYNKSVLINLLFSRWGEDDSLQSLQRSAMPGCKRILKSSHCSSTPPSTATIVLDLFLSLPKLPHDNAEEAGDIFIYIYNNISSDEG